jgi:hypothetical protein
LKLTPGDGKKVSGEGGSLTPQDAGSKKNKAAGNVQEQADFTEENLASEKNEEDKLKFYKKPRLYLQ